MKPLRMRSKIWLEIEGQPFLGDGRYRILSAVQRTGSISAAARELGMSYRKVWSMLQAMEAIAPFPVMECRVGGPAGGATRLTSRILTLMKQFEELRRRVNAQADQSFLACFAPGVEPGDDDVEI